MIEINRRMFLAGTGLGVATLAAGPLRAAMPATPLSAPLSAPLSYVVRRDGSPIGEHVITFRDTPDGREVTFATDIAVKVAFITAYRFTHEGREVWTGDRLSALDSRTDDDGTKHKVHAAASADGLTVTADEVQTTLPADTLVHDNWNPANTSRSRLLSIYDGQVLAVSFSGPVTETVEANHKTTQARRFDATGDLTRSFWFDTDGRLVKAAFVSHGSDITYDLRL